MGATCGSLNCKSSKYTKQPRANIIKRPTQRDLSQEIYDQQKDQRITQPPDEEQARIGVFF